MDENETADHDLGDESNPDVGTMPGHGGDDLAGDEAQWATVERVRDADDAAT